MKNNLFLLSILAIFALACKKEKTEKTVTLQPGPSDGNSIYTTHNDSDPSWAAGNVYNLQQANKELPVATSTNGGAVIKSRAYVSFGLSAVPPKAEIVSAKLSLFGLPSSFTIPQGNQGDNTVLIQRITDNWSQTSMTWNNQPSTTSEGQVTVPGTTTRFNYNMVDVDVTGLVKAMRANTPDKTGGFCIRLKNETPVNTVIFASSRNADESKRPKLVIIYKD